MDAFWFLELFPCKIFAFYDRKPENMVGKPENDSLFDPLFRRMVGIFKSGRSLC